MGNNKEIRKRLETYRSVLLAVVWIGAIVGMIGGLVMINFQTGSGWGGYSTLLKPYGIALLLLSIFGGIIGHFLVNVGLAIPFILLNNGDYLAAIVREGKIVKSAETNQMVNLENNNPAPTATPVSSDTWVCKECDESNPRSSSTCKGCGAYR